MRNIVVALIAILMLTGIANALEFHITPKNPVRGQVVTIYGKAKPGQVVRIDVTFERTVRVRNGRYVFSVNGVKIPNCRNVFKVTAYGCEDLKVSVKVFFIWITLGSNAVNGVATVSRANVPPGTYDVIIHGRAKGKWVRLKITATGFIKADNRGYFKFSYDTSCIPPGTFTVTVNGISRVVRLSERRATQSPPPAGGVAPAAPVAASTPTPSTPKQTPTPSLTPSPTPPPTPKPRRTPLRIMTPTVKSNVHHQNKTQRPVKQTTPKPATPTPTPTKKRIPGFGILIALASLILAVNSLKKRGGNQR